MRTYTNATAPTFTLSKSEIAALVEYASDDTMRPALSSVAFFNDGHAVANSMTSHGSTSPSRNSCECRPR